MSVYRLIAALAIASAAASAFAATPDTPAPQQQDKTRAQVRAELIEAYREGIIPTTDGDYPPSQDTINYNRAHFAANPPPWANESPQNASR